MNNNHVNPDCCNEEPSTVLDEINTQISDNLDAVNALCSRLGRIIEHLDGGATDDGLDNLPKEKTLDTTIGGKLGHMIFLNKNTESNLALLRHQIDILKKLI